MAHGRIGKPLDFSEVKTYSARERAAPYDTSRLARVPNLRAPLDQFFNCLPKTGKAAELLDLAEHIVASAANGRLGIWIIGAAVLERGLAPLIIKLMELRIIHHLMLDGAAAARDLETAFFGHLREDEPKDLRDGLLGMARETGDLLNGIINDGARRGFGIGYSLGRGILDRRAPYDSCSLLANAAGHRVPLTVHVSIGADAFHLHPEADGSLLGKGAYKDFQLLAGQIPEISQGGLVINLFDGDLLARVFMRALNAARNQEHVVSNFFAADFQSGTPAESLHLAASGCGKCYAFSGHPELLVPMLAAATQRLLR